MSDEKDEKLENEAETPETEGAEEAKSKPEKKAKKRRGSAETTTSAKRETVVAPRDAEGNVSVRAQAKYVRCAPRKARLVVNHIRGKSVDDARAILGATPRAASRDVLKLLDSAVANAENNHELVADELRVAKVFV
ncbi:MAG: 50S ribosomal protein L22, partial [Gaiellaceae bacterium]